MTFCKLSLGAYCCSTQMDFSSEKIFSSCRVMNDGLGAILTPLKLLKPTKAVFRPSDHQFWVYEKLLFSGGLSIYTIRYRLKKPLKEAVRVIITFILFEEKSIDLINETSYPHPNFPKCCKNGLYKQLLLVCILTCKMRERERKNATVKLHMRE